MKFYTNLSDKELIESENKLNKYFEEEFGEEKKTEKPLCFIPNDTNILCRGKRNRKNEIFTSCQTCKLCEIVNKR
ncbi:hypothetical protein [Brassicibacter mesophilus]|uniref:hypothetical protein n=1 Tax=Brassicibacter mesophilus TaxID=745119 RepID=UPI003D227C34